MDADVLLIGLGRTIGEQQNNKIISMDYRYHKQTMSLPTIPLSEVYATFHLANAVIACGSSVSASDGDETNCLCYESTGFHVWLQLSKKLRYTRKGAAGQVLQYNNEANETVTQLWVLGGAVTQAKIVMPVGQSTDFLTLDPEVKSDHSICTGNRHTSWKIGVDMLIAVAGHCTVAVGSYKILLIGGYTTENYVVKDTSLYNVLEGRWEILAEMRQARKQHTCSKFDLKSGFEVAVVAGGEDGSGNPLGSCELFYLKEQIRQWTTIQGLPLSLKLSSMIMINKRLILSGGISEGFVQDAIWIFDETNGWHYFNQKLSIPLYAHISALWEKEYSQN